MKRLSIVILALTFLFFVPTITAIAFPGGTHTQTVLLNTLTTVYNGEGQSIGAAVVTGEEGFPAPSGAVTYRYFTDAGLSSEVAGLPLNAGTYYAIAYAAADEVYADAESAPAVFTIQKKQLSGFTADIGTVFPRIYDGTTVLGGGIVIYTAIGTAHGVVIGDTVDEGTNYDAAGELVSKDAGCRSVNVTVTLKGEASLNYAFNSTGSGSMTAIQESSVDLIMPAVPLLTLPDKTVTYTGTPVAIGAAAVTGISDIDVPAGTVSYIYTYTWSSNPLEGPPIDSGFYYAKAFIAASGNYAAAESANATVYIRKAVPTVTLHDKTMVYTGYGPGYGRLVVTGVNGETIENPSFPSASFPYFYDRELSQPFTGVPGVVGTYYLKVSIVESINYLAAESNVASVTITPYTPIVSTFMQVFTYNGLPIPYQPAFVYRENGWDDYVPSVTHAFFADEACTQPIPGTPRDAGWYYLKAYVAASGNYAAAESWAASIIIYPAQPSISIQSVSAVYSGLPVQDGTITVTGITPSDKPTGSTEYKYYSDADCYDSLQSAPKDAGTYYVRAFIRDHGNYSYAMSDRATLTIEPAEAVITLYPTTKNYTGFYVSISKTVTGISPDDVPDGDIIYKYYNSAAAISEAERPTQPGTHYVRAFLAASGNYKAAKSNTAALKIVFNSPEYEPFQCINQHGDIVTLLTGIGSGLHLNWTVIQNLILNDDGGPALFSPFLRNLEDGSLELEFDILPTDSSIGVGSSSDNSRRTFRVPAWFIRRLISNGISRLSLLYNGERFNITISDITSLPVYGKADLYLFHITQDSGPEAEGSTPDNEHPRYVMTIEAFLGEKRLNIS